MSKSYVSPLLLPRALREVHVSRCSFRDCRQPLGSGGGVCCEALLAVHFESSLFERCSAPGAYGGAVYAVARALHMAQCSAWLCDSARGFFMYTSTVSLSIARCSASDCRGDAGAIYTEGAAGPSLTDLNFTRGTAATAGAALYFAPSPAGLTRNCFLGVDGCAGPNAVYAGAPAFSVEDSRFADNSVGPAGCVLHAALADGAYEARRCAFRGNGAPAAGGPGRFAFVECAMEGALLLETFDLDSLNESFSDSDSDWTTASPEESESLSPTTEADATLSQSLPEPVPETPSDPSETAQPPPPPPPRTRTETESAPPLQSRSAEVEADSPDTETGETVLATLEEATDTPTRTRSPPQSTGLPVTPRTTIPQTPLATDPDWLHAELVNGLTVMMVLFIGGAIVIIVIGVIIFCCCCHPKLLEKAQEEPSSCEDKEDLESLFMSTATTKNFLSQHQDGIIETTAATQAYDVPTIPLHTEEDDVAW